jgi:hypothetical protein
MGLVQAHLPCNSTWTIGPEATGESSLTPTVCLGDAVNKPVNHDQETLQAPWLEAKDVPHYLMLEYAGQLCSPTWIRFPREFTMIYLDGWGLRAADYLFETSFKGQVRPGDSIVVNLGPHYQRSSKWAEWNALIDRLAEHLEQMVGETGAQVGLEGLVPRQGACLPQFDTCLWQCALNTLPDGSSPPALFLR